MSIDFRDDKIDAMKAVVDPKQLTDKVQQLKNLDSKLRIKKEIGFNDLLPWFDNYVKGIITNG